MRIAYLDCFSGISGDMFLGALVDAGLDFETWLQRIKRLSIPGLDITQKKVTKGSLAGTKLEISCDEQQSHRNFQDIKKIIETSPLSMVVREKSLAVFKSLAEAEAKVHGIDMSEVHFHEVGALDAIADILGGVLALEMLEVESLYCSKIHCGTGVIDCAHGTLPVPAPATAELLKGLPVYSRGIEAELVTPTGAALIAALTDGVGSRPDMIVDAIGYGAGSRELSIPNLLRIQIGEAAKPVTGQFQHEEAMVMEANIDDMQPEIYGYITNRLFELGAQDVYLTPIYMKKGRPAVTLSFLVHPEKVDVLAQCVFEETTTLGLRMYRVNKVMLMHETVMVETAWGEVQVKLGLMGGKIMNIAPEYEDCIRLARENDLPLKEVYQQIILQARKQIISN